MAQSTNQGDSTQTKPFRQQRIVLKLTEAVGQDVQKQFKIEQACKAAIADCIDVYIETLDAAGLHTFFATLECAANAKGQKAIAAHPLRPGSVQDAVDAARAKEAADKEARKAQKAAEDDARRRAIYEELRSEFGADASNDSSKPSKSA